MHNYLASNQNNVQMELYLPNDNAAMDGLERIGESEYHAAFQIQGDNFQNITVRNLTLFSKFISIRPELAEEMSKLPLISYFLEANFSSKIYHRF